MLLLKRWIVSEIHSLHHSLKKMYNTAKVAQINLLLDYVLKRISVRLLHAAIQRLLKVNVRLSDSDIVRFINFILCSRKLELHSVKR